MVSTEKLIRKLNSLEYFYTKHFGKTGFLIYDSKYPKPDIVLSSDMGSANLKIKCLSNFHHIHYSLTIMI